VYVSPGPWARPGGGRGFWVGGVSEGQRGIGSVGDVVGEGEALIASAFQRTKMGLFCRIHRPLLPYMQVSFTVCTGLFCRIHRSDLHSFALIRLSI